MNIAISLDIAVKSDFHDAILPRLISAAVASNPRLAYPPVIQLH